MHMHMHTNMVTWKSARYVCKARPAAVLPPATHARWGGSSAVAFSGPAYLESWFGYEIL